MDGNGWSGLLGNVSWCDVWAWLLIRGTNGLRSALLSICSNPHVTVHSASARNGGLVNEMVRQPVLHKSRSRRYAGGFKSAEHGRRVNQFQTFWPSYL
jgi:hypothetical protein